MVELALGYGVVWAVIFVYTLTLVRRQARIEAELRRLRGEDRR